MDGDTQTLEQKLSGSRLASGVGNAATNVPENVAASSPRAPNVSTASGTKQYWSHNAVYFARLRSSASTATVQAAIDARCRCRRLVAVVSGHCEVPHQAPVVWPWHQCQAIWKLAIIVPRQTRRLQSGGNLHSSERALYEIIDGAVSRMTTGRPPAWQTMNTILVDVLSADA